MASPGAINHFKSLLVGLIPEPALATVWTPDHDAIVTDFLSDLLPRRLIAHVDTASQHLILLPNVPGRDVTELMYFIKNPTASPQRAGENAATAVEAVTEENFEKVVQYGTIAGDLLESLLRMMQGVYTPIFMEDKGWPESVRIGFRSHLHRFMAILTDATFQVKGHTVLYVPKEQFTDLEQAAKSKDVIVRLESLLIHWTQQIKEVVNSQHTSEITENAGPLEEIQFWRSRCDDLSGISDQLSNPELKRILDITALAKSSYLDSFIHLSNLINEGTLQAQDNLRFLKLLIEPCEKLAAAEPKDIPQILPNLLSRVRVVWKNSKFYNTKERLTGLLRKISTEIIRRCCAKISLEDIFYGYVHSSMASLTESISCGESWKIIYKEQVALIARKEPVGWDFDQSSIFAQVDAFVQRCRDLMEVCEGQIQFARKMAGNEKMPIPIFGGCNGPDIAKSFEDIENAFDRQIESLWKIRHFILDVKATRWHDDFNSFKQGVKDLEVMLQNVIISAFEGSNTVESAVELLEIFHFLAKRETIKRTVEKKTAEVFAMFLQELNAVKVEFETHKRTPDILRSQPDFAGSAYWAKSLLKRITFSMNTLKDAYYLPPTPQAMEVKEQFEPLASSIEEYISKTHQEWSSNVSSDIALKLEEPLMVRKGDFLDIKFDRGLLRLYFEIFYWQKLKCDIPFHIQEIYSKREELRILRENVLLVTRDYNEILETLTPEEHMLFKERIRFLDRKINPGLTSLNWASKGVTEYFIKECRRHSHDIQTVVTSFLESVRRLRSACTSIAELPLLQIEAKKIYDLEEFSSVQDQYRKVAHQKLSSAHSTIVGILETMHHVFKNDSREVQAFWVKFVEKIDAMLEDALRTSVKRSLLELGRAINGEGKSREAAVEILPLFKLNVILESQKVDFSPTLQRLEDTVNKVAQEILSSIAIIPRLAETLAINSKKEVSAFIDVIANEDDMIKTFVAIQKGLSNNTLKCQNYLRSWDSYREIWEVNKDAFIRRYAKHKPALSTFDADINRYNEVANNTQKEETLINLNFVRLDSSILKQAIVSHCAAWQNKLTSLLNLNAYTELSTLNDMFQKKTQQLLIPPSDLEQLTDAVQLLTQLQAEIPAIEQQFGPITEQYQILEKYEVPVKDEEKALLEALPGTWAKLQQAITEAEKMLSESKAKFKSELQQSVDDFNRGMTSIREEFTVKGPFTAGCGVEKAMKSIAEYKQIIDAAVLQENNLKRGLAVFKQDPSANKDIKSITAELENLSQVWNLTLEWSNAWDEWKFMPFLKLNANEMEEVIQKIQKKILRCPKECREWEVYQNLKDKVAQCKRTVPVLQDLRNPALRTRHWQQLMDDTGRVFDPNSTDFTLEKILEIGLDQNGEAISSMSAAATKELLLEEGLNNIKLAWDQLELDIIPYKEEKGYFKVRSTDAIFEVLEDNQVTLSSMKASKYFSAFETEVNKLEQVLSTVMEVIEVLLLVQKQWIYLENIFIGAEDIRKQLPKESAVFEGVNTRFKEIMTQMVTIKNVRNATHQDGLFATLTEMNQKLEKIQKSLDMYLETKRQAFPRFYFLSNDDLLEILGQAKDPNAVQPHLKKCFDNLHKLELSVAGTDNRRHFEASGMHSGDGEFVPFLAPVVIEGLANFHHSLQKIDRSSGSVESWLISIEYHMRSTLKKLLFGSLAASKKSKRDKWIKDWPGQLLITAGLITWTQDCTKALQEMEKGEKHALKALKKKQISALKKMADLVRLPISKVERKKLIALVTVEVHSRDVIEKMAKTNCESVNAFEWLSQLRFYWEKDGKDEEDCIIRQINTRFHYGYEYLGNSGRLVITPLTDRCYMTLTTALNLQRGGSPQGPAGTGKTETVKDLGKALGTYVIVQNCSDTLDYKSIGRMFSGLAQTGAWGCFDEFNRYGKCLALANLDAVSSIDIEVLSVVALQISSILQAIARNAVTFVFEGQEIKLNTSCGIFITMNPGYAGRVELPDNLKSLFRPVSMMVPDSALIAEIMLFAEGFSNTRVLSKKVDTLYRLAAQQLSKQDHYDFGLRALTTALRYAGGQKRKDINVPDEIVLLCSMRDNNVPKLTAEDTPLFIAMLSDLFPGVEPIVVDYSEFKAVLQEQMKLENLQFAEVTIQKTIQLYETKLSRHGVMVVGSTGCGKSTVWKLLQSSLNQLSKSKPESYVSVKSYPLNPKAFSQGELYGEVNVSTNEWSDGVLSSIMRTACSDEKKDQKWIILDGPVDTLWIESMNTVLDDNKVLTLINGERIALPEQVSLLFEVDNLSTASPATVSRAGMIYIDYQDLGWNPIFESWLVSRSDVYPLDTLRSLAAKYVSPALDFRKQCQELVPVPEGSAVKSFCMMYDALAVPENGVTKEETDLKLVEMWFIFSVIWAIGGSLTDESRRKFDMFMREIEGLFPSKDTVYEYSVDKQTKTWVPWEDKLPTAWKYNPSLSFYKIYVPTVDTIRNEFLVQSLINRQKPVLLVGEVGTGKTSLVKSCLSEVSGSVSVLCINMSAQTSSNGIQSVMESKMEKRTKNVFVPVGGKNMITFVDDFNMPAKDTFGSQPPLELLRHWVDYGFVYDRQKQSVKYITNMQLLTAMGPPGGGRQVISERVQSRFILINMAVPSEASLHRIFGTIINQKIQDFEEDVKPLGDIITTATVEIYHSVISNLLPTPSKMHYLFNLRDISKVFQGLCRAQRDYYDSREVLTRLWVHEMTRVMCDRLISKEDKEYFFGLIEAKLISHFGSSLKQLFGDKKITLFADFLTESQTDFVYEEITDNERLKRFIDEKMMEYNTEPGFVPIDLVLFRDAVEHVVRIARILRLPCGNVLLIGVGGSGRQSLARLSSYIVGQSVFQIKVTKNYRHVDFREDLKKLYRMTGLDNKPTSFVFTDSQALSESFMEDINNILSSGEVPNLFLQDEVNEIQQTLSDVLSKEKAGPPSESLFQTFIERVKSNLHIILCMSPVGDAFKNRLRMFPSIINCTTIDWFAEWPNDALNEVAQKYLEEVDLGSDAIKKGIVQTFVHVHQSVVEISKKMIQELKRYNYVTPTNYLELVTGYRELLNTKRKEIEAAAFKLRNGLSKLDDTRKNVETISVELEAAKKTDYLVIIVQQKREADEQAKAVAAKAEKLGVEEEEVRAVADAAQADLDQAMPALLAAVKALEGINKKDLNEIRSYGKPPPLVEKVMEAVMVLKKCEPTWDEAKRQLGNPYFIKQLINFDKDNISDKILKKISQYCADESFHPDIVGRVSGASKSLCMWVRAMETYGIIFRQVAPKKEKLRIAQETLEKKQKTLREAKAKLQEIQDKLTELKNQYDEKVGLKEKLRQDSEMTELKLMRAEQLVSGLSGERGRWEKSIKAYEESLKFLPGDCLLAAAFLSYAGPFNSTYRSSLVNVSWIQHMKSLELPFSSEFTVEQFLGKPTEIRDWNIQGLPSDSFSSENGIMVTCGRRWPLMIDPQGQANTWVKAMELSRDLKVVDLKAADFLRTLEGAIQFGVPVLLQNLTEYLDPVLDPIISKSIVKKAGRLIIKLGEKEVEYNPEFRLYMTTRLPNPHYPPEIFAKATIVNFAVKEKGLEDQLLGIVVRREKPELEDQKNALVSSVANARRKLLELEDEILHLLSTAQGSLLDDEKLVNALQSSKSTSEDVTNQLVISEQTEKRIDAAREGYRPCAERASVLYFVLNGMGFIDTMYQFSLDAYVDLFEKSIAKSKKFEDIAERIASLNDYHTYAVYKNACRGLFEQHKILFSLQITFKIMEAAGKLNMEEYDFFLRGGQVLNKDVQVQNGFSSWISDTVWDNITELDKLVAFSGLIRSIEQSERDWRSWFMGSEPEASAFPGEWENKVNDLQRMLLVRCFRPDRVQFCAQSFVSASLGQKFVEPPVLDIADILDDSLPKTPLIFVLSPGVDPTNSLLQLAQKQNMADRFHNLSLGQGQAPKATKMILDGMKQGWWVFLANCHLSISWMPSLDKLVEGIPAANPHPSFRLWLSSSPSPHFPISILQAGIKMTTEPPKGLKANLVRLYASIEEASYPKSTKPQVYQKLLLSLSFYHSLLLERKKFLSLGWNVVCDFNNSDFEVCENLLVVLLDEYSQIPWDALKYLIAEANYGGRVTDDWDRRILRSYINSLFNEDAISQPSYKISTLSLYYIPENLELQLVRDYIAGLPAFDHPEVFGQHTNADIASQIKESEGLLTSLLSMQPKTVTGAGLSREEKVMLAASDILKKLPESIDYQSTQKQLQYDPSPLNTVLLQEIKRYNNLLEKIRKSISSLQQGIQGIVVMTPELDEIFNAIFDSKVPLPWSKTYLSLKPLASWTRDLNQRVEHFAEWARGNEPKLFWIGAFTFPTGFLTAVLQKTARKNSIPVDTLSWEFNVLQLDDSAQITGPPKEGVYVKNLYIEGASWDKKNNTLCDSKPMELISSLPPIHFKPVEGKKRTGKGLYACPLYYYPARSGTREHPSFIIAMDLKSGVNDQDFYVKHGVAALASLG
ncbi:dynein heavy chain and region D6 of dynein motor-domain-containing protein [Zopfochytrium polystomum]|nr:dynein heavy chain and region D6 of dynein motor-domain-containing protein [Zopfochytrium polystomum]